jgi:hypothetical protein
MPAKTPAVVFSATAAAGTPPGELEKQFNAVASPQAKVAAIAALQAQLNDLMASHVVPGAGATASAQPAAGGAATAANTQQVLGAGEGARQMCWPPGSSFANVKFDSNSVQPNGTGRLQTALRALGVELELTDTDAWSVTTATAAKAMVPALPAVLPRSLPFRTVNVSQADRNAFLIVSLLHCREYLNAGPCKQQRSTIEFATALAGDPTGPRYLKALEYLGKTMKTWKDSDSKKQKDASNATADTNTPAICTSSESRMAMSSKARPGKSRAAADSSDDGAERALPTTLAAGTPLVLSQSDHESGWRYMIGGGSSATEVQVNVARAAEPATVVRTFVVERQYTRWYDQQDAAGALARRENRAGAGGKKQRPAVECTGVKHPSGSGSRSSPQGAKTEGSMTAGESQQSGAFPLQSDAPQTALPEKQSGQAPPQSGSQQTAATKNAITAVEPHPTGQSSLFHLADLLREGKTDPATEPCPDGGKAPQPKPAAVVQDEAAATAASATPLDPSLPGSKHLQAVPCPLTATGQYEGKQGNCTGMTIFLWFDSQVAGETPHWAEGKVIRTNKNSVKVRYHDNTEGVFDRQSGFRADQYGTGGGVSGGTWSLFQLVSPNGGSGSGSGRGSGGAGARKKPAAKQPAARAESSSSGSAEGSGSGSGSSSSSGSDSDSDSDRGNNSGSDDTKRAKRAAPAACKPPPLAAAAARTSAAGGASESRKRKAAEDLAVTQARLALDSRFPDLSDLKNFMTRSDFDLPNAAQIIKRKPRAELLDVAAQHAAESSFTEIVDHSHARSSRSRQRK